MLFNHIGQGIKLAARVIPSMLTVALLMPTTVLADNAVGLGLSTQGVQLSFAQSISENINIKVAYNTASSDFDGETDGIDYEYDFDFDSIGLLLDWHAFANSFRFTAGAIANNNEIQAESRISSASVQVGDTTFTSAQVGRIEGDITFDSFAPYLGIGWGRAVAEGFGFNFDLGLMFQGEPEVDLRSVGGILSSDPILLAEVEREEQELQYDVDDFDLYPVVSVSVSYSF